MAVSSGVKNKSKQKKNRPFIFVLVLVMFGYFAWVFTMQQIEFYSRNKALAQIERRISAQQQLSEELARKYEMVNSPEYIEKMAREQLGYARSDETIYYDATMKR